MREEIVYLDSSVIIRRYIEEPGGLEIGRLYKRPCAGEIVISYSLWNAGKY